jgi:uncharacterized protein YdeI (YjbR/CyaY-like superfamily)
MPHTTDKGVEIPDELAIALAGKEEAKVAFDVLAPEQQREWAEHVEDAKQPDTRQRRAAKAVEELTGTPE